MELSLDFILRKSKRLLEDFEQRIEITKVHLKVINLFSFLLDNYDLKPLCDA